MINITKIYLVSNCFEDPNKVYIGKTINCRKSRHIKSFGESITYDYIDEINSIESKDWKILESFWIDYFKFLGFEVLNKNEGGGGPSFQTEESRKRISDKIKGNKNLLGYKFTEEQKSRMRKPRSKEFGEKLSRDRKGKKQSKETKKKRSKALKGKPNKKLYKPIIQCDIKGNPIKEWISTKDAAQKLGIDGGNICNCLKGKYNMAGGYMWKYA